MKTTTFKINNTSSNCINCPFHTTDYSKALDNIIAANIAKTNPYLFKTDSYTDHGDFIDNLIEDAKKITISDSYLNSDDEFAKAIKFINNYGKKSTTYAGPFIIGKIYKLANGTPICFYNDEIQIGYDIYSYSDFGNPLFLKKLSAPTKNIIINIFNAGNKNIKINII